jgi:uncharacterized protein YutE (UPF0331/DUF86 family)
MKYNGVIEKKLLVIEEKVNLIEQWNVTSFAMLTENTMLQNAVEQALQVAIEAVIDTAEHILAIEEQWPDSADDAINIVQQLGIIKKNPMYADLVQLRNFIVYNYEKVDLAIVYSIIKKHLSVFRTFIAEIRNT